MPRDILATVLLLLTNMVVAADPVELYKQAYQQAMTDQIGDQLAEKFREQGVDDEQIKANIAHIISEMAHCQVGLLDGYEKRYADIAYAVTANGGSLAESNTAIEKQMERDLANGAISEEHLSSMVNTGIAYVKECTARIFR